MTPIAKFFLYLSAGLAGMAPSQPVPLANGESLSIGRGDYIIHAADREGPVTLIEEDTIRFTVEPGDQWIHDKQSGARRERAEISSRDSVVFGQIARASVDLRLAPQEAGGPGTWMLVAQLHGPNRRMLAEDSVLRSPPFAMQVSGDRLIFLVRSGRAGDDAVAQQRIGSIPADFAQWHRYDFYVQTGQDGRVTILRDGEIAIDWVGPVGYDAGDGMHYWKFGIYRSAQWQGPSQLDLRIACAGSLEGCVADNP